MAIMINKAIKLGAACVMVASLAACGGGEDADPGIADTFQTYKVNVDRLEAKAGVNIAASADFTTFGPTIKQAYWRYRPIGDATGTLSFSDEACADAQINNRTVEGTDKKRSIWRCETTVTGQTGTKGQFRLLATAIDSDGNTAQDAIVITITR